jgi:glucose-6-phosphate isomerase
MQHSPEWKALIAHFQKIKNTSLSELFNQQPERGTLFSLESLGLYLDYSKNHINRETLKLLEDFSQSKHLKKQTKALFSGEIVNTSENRPALHTALRDLDNSFSIDTKQFKKIDEAREKTLKLAEKLITGELKNPEGNPFKHLVCLGIGGSYLGPKFVTDALENFNQSNIDIQFIASIDPTALVKVLKAVNIKECLFFIASKSFNTLETLQSANTIKQALAESGVKSENLAKHFSAATHNIEAAKKFPCDEGLILPIEESIGGRFSLWSSIGLPIAAALGTDNFLQLLKGAHSLDKHFFSEEPEANLPILLAFIAFWYQTFFEANTRTIIPYSHKLKTLPAYLQQLEMESLGKTTSKSGEPITQNTGAIIWGSEGPNSQHAFHQLLLQGSHTIPSDFIAITHSEQQKEAHRILNTQCIAQSQALAFGETNTDTQKTVLGNQPSNTLFLNELNPHNLGSLLSLYEHKVFVQSVLMNINAFDQWGVELGKKLTKQIYKQEQDYSANSFDSSTKTLLNRIKE